MKFMANLVAQSLQPARNNETGATPYEARFNTRPAFISETETEKVDVSTLDENKNQAVLAEESVESHQSESCGIDSLETGVLDPAQETIETEMKDKDIKNNQMAQEIQSEKYSVQPPLQSFDAADSDAPYENDDVHLYLKGDVFDRKEQQKKTERHTRNSDNPPVDSLGKNLNQKSQDPKAIRHETNIAPSNTISSPNPNMNPEQGTDKKIEVERQADLSKTPVISTDNSFNNNTNIISSNNNIQPETAKRTHDIPKAIRSNPAFREERPASREAPQVKIGQINVLIDDQAAAKSKRTIVKPSSRPSNPFGIRGL